MWIDCRQILKPIGLDKMISRLSFNMSSSSKMTEEVEYKEYTGIGMDIQVEVTAAIAICACYLIPSVREALAKILRFFG